MGDEKRPFTVRIRRTADGLERDYFDEYGRFDNTSTWAYMWTDGNYGCDCNRALFFARCAGEDDPDDRECGNGAFEIVRITDVATGEVICEGEPVDF